MSKSPSPALKRSVLLKFVRLIVPLLGLAGLISCGGASNTPKNGGGGGGGGGNSANCSPSVPFSTSPGSQSGVGKVVPSTFLDLYLVKRGRTWPSCPFAGL